jgi:hypothetical protein
MVPSVFGSLSENGYFYDPVERGMVKLCILTNSEQFIYQILYNLFRCRDILHAVVGKTSG